MATEEDHDRRAVEESFDGPGELSWSLHGIARGPGGDVGEAADGSVGMLRVALRTRQALTDRTGLLAELGRVHEELEGTKASECRRPLSLFHGFLNSHQQGTRGGQSTEHRYKG